MSNLDPEKDYSDLTDCLDFVFKQLMKKIYISIPGIIVSYDEATKRATVTPAINIRKTDGTIKAQTPIVNVPVLFPSGGGYTVLMPVAAGDAVEIKFSQRGITRFKETFSTEDPGTGLFSKEDAYIQAGFGALSVTPAVSGGASLQTEDGNNFLAIDDAGKILIESASVIDITAPVVNVIADEANIETTGDANIEAGGDVNIDSTGGDATITVTGMATIEGADIKLGAAASQGVSKNGDVTSVTAAPVPHTHNIISNSKVKSE